MINNMARLNFSRLELQQLLSYCEERDKDGWYYGSKKQFEKRHIDMKTQIEETLENLKSK